MFKKIILVSSLLITSLSAQAALISHFGYERDSASNIVKGGGLEWLMWDVTKGQSVDRALSEYAIHGWRLASYTEIASAFTAFKFSDRVWSNDEVVGPWVESPWNVGDPDSPYINFISLFGVTVDESCSVLGQSYNCALDHDPYRLSGATYSSSANAIGHYSYAYVHDDLTVLTDSNYIFTSARAGTVYNSVFSGDASHPGRGLALVRSPVPANVAVPTPGPIGLLALGLVALGYGRRHGLGR